MRGCGRNHSDRTALYLKAQTRWHSSVKERQRIQFSAWVRLSSPGLLASPTPLLRTRLRKLLRRVLRSPARLLRIRPQISRSRIRSKIGVDLPRGPGDNSRTHVRWILSRFQRTERRAKSASMGDLFVWKSAHDVFDMDRLRLARRLPTRPDRSTDIASLGNHACSLEGTSNAGEDHPKSSSCGSIWVLRAAGQRKPRSWF